MNIETIAAWATSLSLPVGAVSLLYAARQTYLARRATAATVLIDASIAFPNAWAAVWAATEEGDRLAAFGDLLNLLEACCATYRDGMLVGQSGRLLETYVVNVLVQIDQSEAGRSHFNALVETDKTFEQIGWFLRKKRKQSADFAKRLLAYQGS